MQFLGQKQSLVEGADQKLESYRQTKIRRLTSVVLNEISPKSVGALMAIWENKTILNSLIWNINAFDQWGVELGKLNTKNSPVKASVKEKVKSFPQKPGVYRFYDSNSSYI